MYCLGIDTSCYTTSLAVVNEAFELCYDGRIILDVSTGGRGLRQSDAFFQHIGNMSRLMEQCMGTIDPAGIKAVAVSTRPRSLESSYMPVFTAGSNTARTIGALLKLPVYELSHQESHIEAGVWSSKHKLKPCFFVYHISGGTTELLYVNNEAPSGVIEIGGSSDLKAGQFIDRAGVAMGIKFPCGREMDRLCIKYDTKGIDIPISIDGCFMSFSGPETHVQRYIGKRAPYVREKSEISRGVFECIAKSIEKTLLNAKKKYDISEVLMVGGVASNTIIREYLKNSSKLAEMGVETVLSDERYSPDNAVGAAVLGMKRYQALGGFNEQ